MTNLTGVPILSIVTFFPIAGALFIASLNREATGNARALFGNRRATTIVCARN